MVVLTFWTVLLMATLFRLFLANKTDFIMGVNGLIFFICKDLHKKILTNPLLIYDLFTSNLITKLQSVKV